MEHQSDHIYYTLLWRVLGCSVPFTSLNKLWTTGLPKPFCWAKPAFLSFHHPILISTATYWALLKLLLHRVIVTKLWKAENMNNLPGGELKVLVPRRRKACLSSCQSALIGNSLLLCGQYSDLRESRLWVQPALPRNSPQSPTNHMALVLLPKERVS
jgi:hypothetical protein